MAVQFSSTSATTSAAFQNPLESIKLENNRATIEKIKDYIAQGFKVCLFVGRGPAEPLPTPSHSKEIWVSLDNSLRTAEELPADRLHLILSGNDSAEMAMIQHLFHTVVVDQSTMKFFDPGILDRLTSLLNVVDVDTSLVFESLIQKTTPDSNIQEWEFDHHSDTFEVNEEKFTKELIEYYEASKVCLDNFILENGGK
ncbi:MAG TPA: hypothetical protein VLE96_01365, partial [Chlamydiales bacterium]|nr:hypothetical protein [Chlamydiales bacterium]